LREKIAFAVPCQDARNFAQYNTFIEICSHFSYSGIIFAGPIRGLKIFWRKINE